MDPNSPYQPYNPQGPQNQTPQTNGYGYPPAGGQQPTQPYNQPGGPQYGNAGQIPNGPVVQPLQPNPYSTYNQSSQGPYPAAPGPTRRRSPNKAIFIGISAFAIILIGLAVVIALSSSGNGTNNNGQQQQPQSTTTNGVADDVEPRNDGQLDLETKVDTSQSIKEQTIKAKSKEQVNLSSGFSFMATKIEPYTSTNPSTKPAAGKKFIAITIAVGNRTQTNSLSVSYLDFKLRDVDNNVIASSSSTQEILSNTLANPTALKPGEQVTGKVVFEVDENDTDWVLIHKESYQKTTDNTTFDVEGDISVSLSAASTTPPATPATPTTPPPATST